MSVTRDPAMRVILMTAPGEEKALEIAEALVQEGLAACVNVVPAIRSVYRWKGAVCKDAETLMIAKARAPDVDELVARVRKLHPYECPEVLCLPVKEGFEDYVTWVLNP